MYTYIISYRLTCFHLHRLSTVPKEDDDQQSEYGDHHQRPPCSQTVRHRHTRHLSISIRQLVPRFRIYPQIITATGQLSSLVGMVYWCAAKCDSVGGCLVYTYLAVFGTHSMVGNNLLQINQVGARFFQYIWRVYCWGELLERVRHNFKVIKYI